MHKLDFFDQQETDAVLQVMDSKSLSGFSASNGTAYLGGKQVQAFEKQFAEYIGSRHAISVNSWSSGILIALGALGVEPGDEVIVSSWNMCSTVTSILHWLCIPVFCDVDPKTYTIDPAKLEECISDKTSAIIVNDMHGFSADIDSIMEIAKKHNLKVLSDSAQSIGLKKNNKYVGTVADIGGYSFNWRKIIHAGEGGICVTNDDTLAFKMRLLRNHAEGVVGDFNFPLHNMIGFNLRMLEIQAAILREQLKKLPAIIQKKKEIGAKLAGVFGKYSFVILPEQEDNVFCHFVMQFTNKPQRDAVAEKLSDYGIECMTKFSRGPVHLLPVFQQQQAFGSTNLPWSLNNKKYNYGAGSLPVVESFPDTFLHIDMEHDYSEKDLSYIDNVLNSV